MYETDYKGYIILEVQTNDLTYFKVLNNKREMVFTRETMKDAKKIIDKYKK